MKRITTTAAACTLLLSLSACQRPAAAPEPVAAPAAAASDAPAAAEPAAAPATPDAGSLLGSFSGTLPCADCNGIETVLELKPDGAYTQRDLYMGKPDGDTRSEGKWTLEANGTRLRLVPDGHEDRAQLYAVTSSDQLQALDRDGNPPKGEFDDGLKRTKQK